MDEIEKLQQNLERDEGHEESYAILIEQIKARHQA